MVGIWDDFRTLLSSSDDIIKALSRIIVAFSNPIEIEVVKTRWGEIKKLQREAPPKLRIGY